MDKTSLRSWFHDVGKGKIQPGLNASQGAFGEVVDKTIKEFFLQNTIPSTRDTFESTVQADDSMDSLVLFYTTDVISYSQRVACYQVNLFARTMGALKYLNKKIKVYSYDTSANAFPTGIGYSSSPPEDFTGEKHGSEELKMAGLPKIYFMPAENKGLPFTQYTGVGNAAELMDWVRSRSSHNLSKAKSADFKMLGQKEKGKEGEKLRLGQRDQDNMEFFAALRQEGIIRPGEATKPEQDKTKKTEL